MSSARVAKKLISFDKTWVSSRETYKWCNREWRKVSTFLTANTYSNVKRTKFTIAREVKKSSNFFDDKHRFYKLKGKHRVCVAAKKSVYFLTLNSIIKE